MKYPDELGTRTRRVLVLAISACTIAIVSCSNLFGTDFDSPSGLKSEEDPSAQAVGEDPLPGNPDMRRYSLEELTRAIAAGAFEEPRASELKILVKLTEVFYGRLARRRINSIATFHDPALREFFRNSEMFADYYADLVQSLIGSYFEGVRPNRVEVRAVMIFGEGRNVKVEVQFRGENSRPLRWWSVYNTREDEWEHSLGQWWIVPRKL